MRNKEFFNSEHAQRYLAGSLIRLDNEPIYVIDVGHKKNTIYFIHLADGTEGNIPISSPLINLNPVPLGFLNWKQRSGNNQIHYASYLQRIPERSWNIGCTHRNIQFRDVMDGASPEGNTGQWVREVLQSKALRLSILGEYPKLPHTMKVMAESQSIRSRAFSRRFAVTHGQELRFKYHSVAVGMMNKNLSFTLLPKYKYLSEILTKDIANACD